jgi:hypothetical protein
MMGLMIVMAGCQTSSKAPYADNPLLMSREPLKQTATTAKSTAATRELQSTPMQSISPKIMNAAQSTSLPKANSGESIVTTENQIIATSAQSTQPMIAIPRLPEPADPSPPVTPPMPPVPPAQPAATTPTPSEKPRARFDHAPDYAWLIGEIDVHYRGHKELRFCPISEENAIGGKVRLVDDPRLAELKAGTLVRVEGELVRDDPIALAGEYPRYHIRIIQVIEKPTK